jgi:signal transduction histidine kinase
VLGLFPDGEVHRRYERLTLRLTWLILVFPVVLLTCSPTATPLTIEGDAPIANPFKIPFVNLDPAVVSALMDVASLAVLLAGAVLLLLRYRSAEVRTRRAMRWLLAPVALLPVAIVVQILLTPGDADVIISLCWAAVIVCFMVAPALGILQPSGLNVDRVVRRSIVYGLLWTSIALVYLIVAATVGAAAGTLLPVGWAVAIGLIVAIAFQPVRTRLEGLADRWVFGAKTDATQLVVGLGESLAGTYNLDTLLPRMRTTLEDGIGLRWVRIRLLPGADEGEPANPAQPVLAVPIEVDGERIGLIECGPKQSGRLTSADTAILETFARQAGMAVRNVRLKEELEHQAARLRSSRARIVHAQELERRRIERNIHDGVQQDLTALIGLAGHARQEFEHDPDAVGHDIAAMQDGLRRVLADLRDFAQGIHPSVLSDRGLLVAVETLAGRHPVPVTIRADTSLRALRLPDEVEGAAYFTIAEAFANTLKHGRADRIDIELREKGDCLIVRVRDDGKGFDAARARGTGLANLRDRVVAVGGALQIDAAPGAGTTVLAEFPLPRETRHP